MGKKKLKWSKREVTAIEGSIGKWENIRHSNGADEGGRNCPMCQEFYNVYLEACGACPVFKVTGREGCAGTPYNAWGPHHRDNHMDLADSVRMKDECPACKRFATQELNFLKDVLKKGVQHEV